MISPATGLNRLALGEDRTLIFSSHNADHYSHAQLGASRSSEDDAGLSNTAQKRGELIANFAIDYGLPGKPGYEYT